MMRIPSMTIATVLLFACAPLAAAQKHEKEPKRPRLDTPDTNDARAYYDFGVRKLDDHDPDAAADAFYWAARLNPAMPEAYYGRRVALLLQDRRRLARYWSGDRRTIRSDDVRRIDSLQLRALEMNPFLYRVLDAKLFDDVLEQFAEEETRGTSVSPTEVRFYLDVYLKRADAETRAWVAYNDRRFNDALRLYAEAIANARNNKSYLMADRGRLFFQIGQADSALAELTRSLEEMRKADQKDLVYVYESKALMEHSIGLVQVRLGNITAAKEAFGRAIQEDMSYAPAHEQLSYLALDAKDSATAVNELDLAVQVRASDPALRYRYGFILTAVGKYAEAVAQFGKALELDPVYASPHYGLGLAYEKQGRKDDAMREYRAFLAAAGKDDPIVAEVSRRIESLTMATRS